MWTKTTKHTTHNPIQTPGALVCTSSVVTDPCGLSDMEGEGALEALGEQLYSLIYPKHAEIAGKLTGESAC